MRWAHRTVTRTRALLAAGLALVIGSGGCSAKPGEPADPQPAGSAPAAGFTAEVTVGGGAVKVAYTLVNRSGGTLVVLSRVDPAYVVGQADGRIQIGQRAFTMPEGDKTWSQPVFADGVRLKDGDKIEKTLTVPLPLTRNHPYGDDYGDGPIALPDAAKEVVFCLGAVRESEVKGTLAAGDEVRLPHLASTTAVQHLYCSDPVKLS